MTDGTVHRMLNEIWTETYGPKPWITDWAEREERHTRKITTTVEKWTWEDWIRVEREMRCVCLVLECYRQVVETSKQLLTAESDPSENFVVSLVIVAVLNIFLRFICILCQLLLTHDWLIKFNSVISNWGHFRCVTVMAKTSIKWSVYC